MMHFNDRFKRKYFYACFVSTTSKMRYTLFKKKKLFQLKMLYRTEKYHINIYMQTILESILYASVEIKNGIVKGSAYMLIVLRINLVEICPATSTLLFLNDQRRSYLS